MQRSIENHMWGCDDELKMKLHFSPLKIRHLFILRFDTKKLHQNTM